MTVDPIHVELADGSEAVLSADPSLSLEKALFVAGLWPDIPLCSGLGRCGMCRVRWLGEPPEPTPEELRIIPRHLLDKGERLACRHAAEPGIRIRLLVGALDVARKKRTTRKPRQLALDLGTTSIQWIALEKGEERASGTGLNPQLGSGADVMSRIAFARKGYGGLLTSRIRERIARIIEYEAGDVEAMCVAGNPAMTHILLGLPLDGLAEAPYRLADAGGDWREIEGLPRCFVPTMLGPFVGGDLSAGVAALHFSPGGPPPLPWVLADMGTNGEFVLALEDGGYLVASVPMGPALEGVGLRHGAMAGPGVVNRFDLTPRGLEPSLVEPLPGGEVAGISGTGYLSLVDALRRAGAMDEAGAFVPGGTPLAAKLHAGVGEAAGERYLALPGNMHLPAADVEELLKLKAAFNVGMSFLLREAGLAPRDLAALCLAGAMGGHVRPAWLERLGFIAPGMGERTRTVGNTSLAGAALLLKNREARQFVRGLPARSRHVELAGDEDFMNAYMTRMVWRHVA